MHQRRIRLGELSPQQVADPASGPRRARRTRAASVRHQPRRTAAAHRVLMRLGVRLVRKLGLMIRFLSRTNGLLLWGGGGGSGFLVSWPISTTMISLLASSSLALLLHLPTPWGELLLWVPAAINCTSYKYWSYLTGYTHQVIPIYPSERMQAPVPPSSPCENNPLCGGYPSGILSTPLPPDFSCIVCQRIASDALIACKGLHAS